MINKYNILFSILRNLIIIRFIIKSLSFKHLYNYLTSVKHKKQKFTSETIINYEARVSKFFSISQCLVRGSLLFSLLKKNCYAAELHIGINFNDKFESHCWVVIHDVTIKLSSKENYKEIMVIK